ncbi:MAG: hypothetical protein P4L16_07150 [Chlamydiales bacterium]|nr:hypothetical protein [Chlamydiales bacterium]
MSSSCKVSSRPQLTIMGSFLHSQAISQVDTQEVTNSLAELESSPEEIKELFAKAVAQEKNSENITHAAKALQSIAQNSLSSMPSCSSAPLDEAGTSAKEKEAVGALLMLSNSSTSLSLVKNIPSPKVIYKVDLDRFYLHHPKGIVKTCFKVRDFTVVRFSQMSVSNLMSDKKTSIHEFHNVIDSEGWIRNRKITLIQMPDNNLTSLDNRRLYALQTRRMQECVQCEGIDVPVIIMHHEKWLNEYDENRLIPWGRDFTDKEIETAVDNALSYYRVKGTYGFGVCVRLNLPDPVAPEAQYGLTSKPYVRKAAAPRY